MTTSIDPIAEVYEVLGTGNTLLQARAAAIRVARTELRMGKPLMEPWVRSIVMINAGTRYRVTVAYVVSV